VEYSPGREKYVLEQDKESDVTLAFLENQAALLVKRESSLEDLCQTGNDAELLLLSIWVAS
jgi:hypothetical protein